MVFQYFLTPLISLLLVELLARVELTALVRYASVGSKFYPEVSVTLSKASDSCKCAFSSGALEKRKQTQGILEVSRNMSVLQTYVRFIVVALQQTSRR